MFAANEAQLLDFLWLKPKGKVVREQSFYCFGLMLQLYVLNILTCFVNIVATSNQIPVWGKIFSISGNEN